MDKDRSSALDLSSTGQVKRPFNAGRTIRHSGSNEINARMIPSLVDASRTDSSKIIIRKAPNPIIRTRKKICEEFGPTRSMFTPP